MNQGQGDRSAQTSRVVGRRHFLTGAAATAAVVAIGCSSDTTTPSGGTTPPTSTTTAIVPPQPQTVPQLSADPFTLGVASGDPQAGAVMIWTRLAPDPLADDGAAGMADGDADVVWEVALDAAFEDPVATGVFTTTSAHGHSAHVDVRGLEPATDYHYRFTYADWISPVGRTRTLPDGDPTAFALGVVNCQMLESGRFGAYRHLVEENLDLVMHLGDYIYEYPGGTGEFASKPNRVTQTLADFRLRYASYHRDPSLQAAHARFPFILTWDDHEVANNYMGDELPGRSDPAVGQARKAAAYQAWWENLPVRVGPPVGSDLTVYQTLDIGTLGRVHLMDQRQDSAIPPCRDGTNDLTDYGNCEERTTEDRTRLGEAQETWLEASLATGGVTWNLLGNPVVLAGVDGGTDEAAFYLDTWDGFPQARQRLIDQLAAVDNPVVLTGDYHAGMVLDVTDAPFEPGAAVVAPEFMAPPISSILFSADASARTPHLRQQLNEHGYLTVALTPDDCTVAFRTVADVKDIDTEIVTAATWLVQAGTPVAEEI